MVKVARPPTAAKKPKARRKRTRVPEIVFDTDYKGTKFEKQLRHLFEELANRINRDNFDFFQTYLYTIVATAEKVHYNTPTITPDDLEQEISSFLEDEFLLTDYVESKKIALFKDIFNVSNRRNAKLWRKIIAGKLDAPLLTSTNFDKTFKSWSKHPQPRKQIRSILKSEPKVEIDKKVQKKKPKPRFAEKGQLEDVIEITTISLLDKEKYDNRMDWVSYSVLSLLPRQ